MFFTINILIMFCAGEFLLQLLGYHGEKSLRISNMYSVDDQVINFRYIPQSEFLRGSVKYHYNRNGIRDYDYPFIKTDNIYRIVMLGDSVAEGYGINLEEVVGKQLEAMLNEDNKTRRFEVINVAMAGLNTYQEAHLLETLGARFSPNLIILSYVLNDADSGTRFNPDKNKEKYAKINVLNIRVPFWFKEILKKSALLLFAKNKIDSLLWRFDINDSDDIYESIKTDYFHKIHKDDEKWHLVSEGFSKISKIAKTINADVMIIIFPVMYDFKKYDWLDIHHKVKAVGNQYGFNIIDLLSEYSKYPVKKVRLERGDFVHPNQLGHQIAAKELFSYISENNLSSK